MVTRKDGTIKKELENFKGEMIQQFHLISEGLIDQIKLLAEGHAGIINQLKLVDQRLDRLEKGNELLAQGHYGTIQRFDQMDTRFDQVDKRLDHMDTRFDQVDKRFDRVETRLDGVETRLDGVETGLDRVETRLDHMEKENERQH